MASICTDLKDMAGHYKLILEILIWSQLTSAFITVLFVGWLVFNLVQKNILFTDHEKAQNILLISGAISTSVTLGVLNWLRRARKKDLHEAFELIDKHCKKK